MRKKKIILILSVAFLLSAAVTGILLAKDRTVPEEPFAPIREKEPAQQVEKIPTPTDREQPESDRLDLDVRDFAPEPVTAHLVSKEIIYDRKEIPE